MIKNNFYLLFLISVYFVPLLCLYDKSSQVIELTASNFKQVENDGGVWLVEFFAPWCGHCQSLVPEYIKAAKALKGVVKVGAVDMTQHQSVGQPYNIQGFPTIKIFRGNKQPIDYKGPRKAQSMIEAVINEVKTMVNERLNGKQSSSKSKSSSKSQNSGDDVVTLTESTFEKTVLQSNDMWLVEFYAPWCGHCKNLEPHWNAAATELKGKIKLGKVDATVYTGLAQKFKVEGFPTIKFFGAGEKTMADAVDYDGGRTSDQIVQWALTKVAENAPPPEIEQVVSDKVIENSCKNKQLCIVAFLPHILDCQSSCRNNYLALFKEIANKFKKHLWGWVWVEARQQPKLEEAFDIGGFGYPAMIAVNSRKLKFSVLTGSFDKGGITEFLRDLSYGKGKTATMRGANYPKLSTIEPWDGKDGVAPVEEDIDLSDVDLDDLSKTEL